LALLGTHFLCTSRDPEHECSFRRILRAKEGEWILPGEGNKYGALNLI
jgi:hypothetical protein